MKNLKIYKMKKTILLLITLTPLLAFSQCISGNCDNGYGVYLLDGDWKEINIKENLKTEFSKDSERIYGMMVINM